MTNAQNLRIGLNKRAVGSLMFILALFAFIVWPGSPPNALATDEVATTMEQAANGCRPPIKKIKPAVIWEGAVAIESVGNEHFLKCAGIDAKIVLTEEESSEYPATRFFGFGGEAISFEEFLDLDLSAVHANMRLTEDQNYIARWLVVGPALTLRGRITEIDHEFETITVQGLTVSITENTRLHKLRIFHVCPPIVFTDLKVGMPVRTVAHYAEEDGAYVGLSVLAAIPPHPVNADGTVE